MACEVLLNKIRDAVKVGRAPLCVVFVDYRAAFDLSSREIILNKQATAGVRTKMLGLVF